MVKISRTECSQLQVLQIQLTGNECGIRSMPRASRRGQPWQSWWLQPPSLHRDWSEAVLLHWQHCRSRGLKGEMGLMYEGGAGDAWAGMGLCMVRSILSAWLWIACWIARVFGDGKEGAAATRE